MAVEVALVVIVEHCLVEADPLIGLVGVKTVGEIIGVLGHRQSKVGVGGDRRWRYGRQCEGLHEINGLVGGERERPNCRCRRRSIRRR